MAPGSAWTGTVVRQFPESVTVVIVLERIELPLQIRRRPKHDMVEILAPDRTDQPFDKGMGDGHVGCRFDLLDTEYPQVGPPSMKHKPGIASDFRPIDTRAVLAPRGIIPLYQICTGR